MGTSVEDPPEEWAQGWLDGLTGPTPFFVLSRRRLAWNVEQFDRLFPGAAIHYAMKANSEPAVLRLLIEAGCGFEVASSYELEILKQLGVAPERIIYGTSVKPASHIYAFVEYGVDRFAVDSYPELVKLAAVAPGAGAYVRALVDDGSSVFRLSEKFGAESNALIPLLSQAKQLGLKPLGISFHVGSQATDPRAWGRAIDGLRPVIVELMDLGISPEILNIGGGFPCRYRSSPDAPRLADIASFTMEAYQRLPCRPQMVLEPGRGLVGDAAMLVTSVIARVDRGDVTWLFLDAGVYSGLFEAMAYQGSTRYRMTSPDAHGVRQATFAVAGPTGDSPDVIDRAVGLPAGIAVGDKVIIHGIGAYSLSVCTPFNGFPKPPVYLV